jgi:hypothetical protein
MLFDPLFEITRKTHIQDPASIRNKIDVVDLLLHPGSPRTYRMKNKASSTFRTSLLLIQSRHFDRTLRSEARRRGSGETRCSSCISINVGSQHGTLQTTVKQKRPGSSPGLRSQPNQLLSRANPTQSTRIQAAHRRTTQRSQNHRRSQAKHQQLILRQRSLTILLQPNNSRNPRANSRSNHSANSTTDQRPRSRARTSHAAYNRQRLLHVIFPLQRPFVIHVELALTCIDQLRMHNVVRPIRQRNVARLQMQHRSPRNPTSTTNLRHSPLKSRTYRNDDSPIPLDCFCNCPGKSASRNCRIGSQRLANLYLQQSPFAQRAFTLRHTRHDHGICRIFRRSLMCHKARTGNRSSLVRNIRSILRRRRRRHRRWHIRARLRRERLRVRLSRRIIARNHSGIRVRDSGHRTL